MQGFPPLHYKPLPPNSPEDHPREELHEENHSEYGSIITPLIECPEGTNFQEGFVPPVNPPLTDPLGPILIQVNSSGEPELDTDYPHLPLVPCEDIVNMESQQLHPSEGFTTPPRVSGPSNPIQTPEQPFGHEIFNRLDTTIDSTFKLLHRDPSHASSHAPHPPTSGISHMFQTSFPHPSPIHSTLQQAQLNMIRPKHQH
jgi:hypothetical protein